MKRGWLVTSFLLSSACAAPVAGPPATGAGSAPNAAPSECSSFSVLVKQGAATASAVDPVQTQIGIMNSRAFAATAPAGLATAGGMNIQRLGQSALLTVRIEAAAGRARATCDWATRRTLEMSRAERSAGLAWLAEQESKLQRELESSRAQLAAFDDQHELLTVPLADQVELVRDDLKEVTRQKRAGKRGLEATLASLRKTALSLDTLEIERDRLLRIVSNQTKLQDVLRERHASSELDGMLSDSVVVLDWCAPCVVAR